MKALVVGAGIGGLAAAAALRRAGAEVEVFERARELRASGSALSLSINARTALRTLGIDLDVEDRGRVYESLRILTHRGRTIRTIPFRNLGERLGAQNVAIHRADLQQALLEAAGDVPIRTGATATSFHTDGAGVSVEFEQGPAGHGDILVGADGFDSAVRRELFGPQRPREPGYVCWLATLPFRHARITDGYCAHYWGRGQRFGLVDIGRGHVYWWGTRNMAPEDARHWSGDKDDIVHAYTGWADEVRTVIEATPAGSILHVPAQDRPAIEGAWGRGPVTLLGDAAHPMLPSLAQGAAMAIEDAVVLAHSLRAANEPAAAVRRYENARCGRAKQMVDGSWALSRIEQLERPTSRLLRSAYFRLLPGSVLDRRNEAVLTFPPATNGDPAR